VRMVVNIFSKQVILTPQQVEALGTIVAGREFIDANYVKDEKGNYATVHTIGTLTHVNTHVTMLSDDEYNTLKFFTANSDLSKK